MHHTNTVPLYQIQSLQGTCKPVMMPIPGISVDRRREGWVLAETYLIDLDH